MFKTVYEKLLV